MIISANDKVPLEKCPALVLNADFRPLSYYPLSLWCWQDAVKSVFLNRFLLILIVSSILIGNAAYEAGNITGASLGISGIINYEAINNIPLFVGIIAFVILYQGNYKIIERSLIILVLLMSLSFFLTAIITRPDISALLAGIFTPKVNEKSILIVLGLIGTTVVPYNIFLHSSLVIEKWGSIKKLKTARIESFISIFLGLFSDSKMAFLVISLNVIRSISLSSRRLSSSNID